MAMKGLRAVAFLAVFVLLALSGRWALSDNPVVTPRSGSVDRGGDVTTNSGSSPVRYEVHDNKTVSSNGAAFEADWAWPTNPKSPWSFKTFGDILPQLDPTIPAYSQLWGAFNNFLAKIDSDTEIDITFIITKDYCADTFPVIAYGNLTPNGGTTTAGPGSSPGGIGHHWSANMLPSGATLELQLNDGGEDDQFIPYSGTLDSPDATGTVTLINGVAGVPYTITVAQCDWPGVIGGLPVTFSLTPVDTGAVTVASQTFPLSGYVGGWDSFAITGVSVPPPATQPAMPAAQPAPVMQVTMAMSTSGRAASMPDTTTNAMWNEVMDDNGTDQLGPQLPGTGYENPQMKGKGYVCLSQMVATVSQPEDLTGLSFRFGRTVVTREWNILQAGNNKWMVTRNIRNIIGGTFKVPLPDSKLPDAAFFWDVVGAKKKLYFLDASGARLSDNNTAQNFVTPPPGYAVGDYYYGEKAFCYTVDVKTGTGGWIECAKQMIYQHIVAKRKAKTGEVSRDWTGLDNSYSTTTLDLKITVDKVKVIVGGDGSNVTIDAAATQPDPGPAP